MVFHFDKAIDLIWQTLNLRVKCFGLGQNLSSRMHSLYAGNDYSCLLVLSVLHANLVSLQFNPNTPDEIKCV